MKTISSTLFHRMFPPERSSASEHPTLIFLHGRGADEEDLLGLAPSLDPDLFLISVRAPFPFPASGGFTWYDVGTMGTPEPETFASSYDRLTAFVGDCIRSYPVDRRRLFLFGFSMGTVMAFSLALTQPDQFRGIVANSGYIPEGTNLTFRWEELQYTDIFLAHGTHDPVIPITAARRAQELLSRSNAHVTYREYPMMHQISEESLTDIAAWMSPRLRPPLTSPGQLP